jgi:hypothetical protein
MGITLIFFDKEIEGHLRFQRECRKHNNPRLEFTRKALIKSYPSPSKISKSNISED